MDRRDAFPSSVLSTNAPGGYLPPAGRHYARILGSRPSFGAWCSNGCGGFLRSVAGGSLSESLAIGLTYFDSSREDFEVRKISIRRKAVRTRWGVKPLLGPGSTRLQCALLCASVSPSTKSFYRPLLGQTLSLKASR
jgi:hypothetical protein